MIVAKEAKRVVAFACRCCYRNTGAHGQRVNHARRRMLRRYVARVDSVPSGRAKPRIGTAMEWRRMVVKLTKIQVKVTAARAVVLVKFHTVLRFAGREFAS